MSCHGLTLMSDLMHYFHVEKFTSIVVNAYVYCLLLSPPHSLHKLVIVWAWMTLPLWCEAANDVGICWWVLHVGRGTCLSPYAVSGINDLFVWPLCHITAFSYVSKNNNNNSSKGNNETNNINYNQCAFSSSLIWFVSFPYLCPKGLLNDFFFSLFRFLHFFCQPACKYRSILIW